MADHFEIAVGREFSDGGDADAIRKFLIPSEWYKVELYGGPRNKMGIPSEKVGEFVGQFWELDGNWEYPTFVVDKENDMNDVEGALSKMDGVREINPYTHQYQAYIKEHGEDEFREINPYDHHRFVWLYWLNEEELPDDPVLSVQLINAYDKYGLIDKYVTDDISSHDGLVRVPNLGARAVQMGWRPWKQDENPAWSYIERMKPRVRAY